MEIKLSLADLDKTLARKGERIGALLIIGGPDVVPFHRLPNPTDDGDTEILSDNPYATFDSNYFVPEWPVGRLPGESGSDAGLLLEQIRNLGNTIQHLTRPITGGGGYSPRLIRSDRCKKFSIPAPGSEKRSALGTRRQFGSNHPGPFSARWGTAGRYWRHPQ